LRTFANGKVVSSVCKYINIPNCFSHRRCNCRISWKRRHKM